MKTETAKRKLQTRFSLRGRSLSSLYKNVGRYLVNNRAEGGRDRISGKMVGSYLLSLTRPRLQDYR